MSGRGSEKRQKTESILVRLTCQQAESIRSKSSALGISSAEYLRRSLNINQTPSSDGGGVISDEDRMVLARHSAALGRLGGLLKHSLSRAAPVRDQELRKSLDQLHAEFRKEQARIKTILDRLP